MALKVTDVAGQAFLDILFGTASKLTTFKLQLITDAVAVADSDTNTTHTVAQYGVALTNVEASLTNDATITTEGGIPVAVWGDIVFTFDGPLRYGASLTGYQVLTGTTLLWAEKISLPTPTSTGDSITITPKFQMGNGTPS